MPYTINDITKGLKVEIDGIPYVVTDFQFVKPGKCQAFNRTRLKNLMNGNTLERTFKINESLEEADVNTAKMQYLYKDGDDFVFMDSATYEQLHVSAATVGDSANFMLENQDTVVALHDGSPLYVELPTSVVLQITYTEPGLQGDRSTGGTKPATLETGYEIAVPLFIDNGTKVKVDTRTGDYLGRVN